MNPYLNGGLIVLFSALGAGAAVATTTHDPWTIGLAAIINLSTTTLALLTKSPLPRKEWTEEERAGRAVPAVPPSVVVKP